LLPNFKQTLANAVSAELIANILETEIMKDFGYAALEAGY